MQFDVVNLSLDISQYDSNRIVRLYLRILVGKAREFYYNRKRNVRKHSNIVQKLLAMRNYIPLIFVNKFSSIKSTLISTSVL